MKDFAYVERVLAVGRRDPAELLDRAKGQVAVRRERGLARPQLEPVPDLSAALHEILGCSPACGRCAEFPAVWDQVVTSLEGQGTVAGKGYDGGLALAQAAFTAVRHLEPAAVVETGVARGVTSRVVLEALVRNGGGHLFSIDLPPLAPGWHTTSAAAITRELQPRWTYLRGSSRRHLPELVARLGDVPLFIHDSLHTYRNMTWEFETVWPALQGLLLCDDVEDNCAFVDFARQRAVSWFVAREPHRTGCIGVAAP